MSTYHLHRWSVVADPYQAPEIQEKRLIGHRDQQPKAIRTGPVVKINGREITTWSGSVYILEDIDPEYRTWLEENNFCYDPENPLTLKKVES